MIKKYLRFLDLLPLSMFFSVAYLLLSYLILIKDDSNNSAKKNNNEDT